MPGPAHDHSQPHIHGHGHAHGHGHGGDPGSRHRDRRLLTIALVITVLICVAEVVGGYLSRSLALTSDAGHMLSDVLGEVLALFALVVADRPRDERKTFGYHRVEILMALLQGAILFGMATLVIWQALGRLRTPPQVETGLMLIVAMVGLLANLACALLLRGGESMNVRGAYLHVLLDTLSSVAVLLAGGVMWLRPGLFILDPLLSIAIGLFIYYSAYRLARDAVEVLLEAAPRGLDVEQIAAGLQAIPGIRHIHDLHIWTITSGMLALSAHLVVEDGQARHNDAILDQAKDLLRQRYRITHSTLQIECDACGDREKVC